MTINTAGGGEKEIAQATGYMIEFESGRRVYIATTSMAAMNRICDEYESVGREVAHARLCIKQSKGVFTVLA